MRSTDYYSDRVVDYIYGEFGIDIISKLMIPEYADALYSIIHLHELNNIGIQDTAIHIIKFIKENYV